MPPHKFNSPLDNEARFIHVVQGESTLYSPTKQISLKSGDSLLMKCGNFVNEWKENKDGSTNTIISFQFFPDVLQYIYNDDLPKELASFKTEADEPFIKMESNELFNNYFENLQSYLDSSSPVTEEFIKIKTRELIYLFTSQHDENINRFLGQLFHSPKYKLQEVVNSNLYKKIKLEDLAFLAGYSLSTFQRKFKSSFGTSPKQYILTQRLNKAKELLALPELRISEIAFDCCFEDPTNFSKAFSKAFGLSPTEYRKSLMA